VNGEGPVLEEAMENLKEAARLVRATQNRLWSAGKIDHLDYRELTHRVSSALAMTEAAYVEARRRAELAGRERELDART
jgi:ABC-type enterobactin transport system permease subunit